MDMIPFEATGSPKANSKTYDTNYSAPKKSTMVGGISIPTLNLHQAGRASMAPPSSSQYNSSSTLSQT